MVGQGRSGETQDHWIGQVLDSCKDEMYVLDAATLAFRHVNLRASSALGYSLNELQEMTPLDISPEFDRQSFEALINPLRTGEQRKVCFNTRHRRKDGSDYSVEVKLHRVNVDGADYLVAVVSDLTEQQAYALSLHMSETRFRTLFNSSADYIFVIDPQGVIMLTNATVECRGGYMRHELVGHNIKEFFTPAAQNTCDCNFPALREKGSSRASVEFVCKDGRVLQMDCSATAIPDQDGHFNSFLITQRDVTEQREAEHRARTHLEESACLMRRSLMGEMAAGLAHELKQPLAAVVSYCGLVKEEIQSPGEPGPQVLDSLERAHQQAHRASGIVSHLQQFIGNQPVDKALTDINEVVRRAVAMQCCELNSSGIELNMRLADDPLMVSVNDIQIEQVLINLLHNAFESIDQAGLGEGRVEITARSLPSGWAGLSVSDNGPGISASIAGNLFRPFHTTKPRGMGMGLSICRSIIREHGGQLLLNRSVSAGARFDIELPTGESAGSD